MKKRVWAVIPILIGICALGAACFLRFSGALKEGEESIIVRSTLMDAIDISELSTSQFTYNGIAKVYKDEEQSKIKCHIRYTAKVKAGINMKDVDFEIDNDNLTVKPILPKIQLTVNLIEEDQNAFSFIPSNVTLPLKDIIAICKKDASQEAEKSEELFEVAEDNLKSTIEALVYPIVDAKGYTIVWE